MTGKHTGHCTVRQNGQSLNASDITVATVLKKAGYTTALVGKWGIGKKILVFTTPVLSTLLLSLLFVVATVGSVNDPSAINLPNPEGFELFFGYNDQDRCHNYYPYWLFLNKVLLLLLLLLLLLMLLLLLLLLICCLTLVLFLLLLCCYSSTCVAFTSVVWLSSVCGIPSSPPPLLPSSPQYRTSNTTVQTRMHQLKTVATLTLNTASGLKVKTHYHLPIVSSYQLYTVTKFTFFLISRGQG